MKDIMVEVVEIRGRCPAELKVGDKYYLRGARISLEESDAICGFAFSNIYPAVWAARLGYDLSATGLTQRIAQCIDPGPPYSRGGTVLFRIDTLPTGTPAPRLPDELE